MSIQQLNNLNLKAGLEADGDVGSAGQVLSSTGPNGIEWIDQSTLVSGSAERVSILVKNAEGTALVKGDPVYIIGSVGASARLEVGLCDASDPSKMPCVGLLEQDLLNNGQGTAVTAGKLRNLITTPIDGQTTTENETIYVKAGGSSGLALTTTKPTGYTNLIQNVGQVGRVSASSDGNLVVSAIMRTNDVPNLPTGKIWVGDGNTTISTVVHLDEINGRMGIGTTSPSDRLEVAAANSQLRLRDTDDNNFAQFSYSSGKLVVRNNSTTTTVNQFTLDSIGRMGIGTTSPIQKVHIDGGSSNSYLHFSNTDTGATSSDGSDIGITSEEDLIVWNREATNLRLATSGIERMRINSSGNVGIGTTSPETKLDVIGGSDYQTINIGESKTDNDVKRSGITFTHYDTDQPEVTLINSYIDSNTSYVSIGGSSATQVATENVRFFTATNTTTTSGTERMRINNVGNVGIGTTSPSQKLHVSGNARVTGAYYDSSNSPGTSGQVLSSTATGTDWIDAGSGSSNWTVSGNDIYNNNSGNVGIGSLTPAEKLDVVGNIKVSGDQYFNGAVIQGDGKEIIRYSDTWLRINEDKDFTNGIYCGNGILRTDGNFQVGPSGTKFTVTTGGSVGIGTTSPDSKLQISGSGTQRLRITSTDGANADLSCDGTSSMTLGSPNGIPIRFVTSNQERARITSTGLVGIGTTNPSQKLDVVGSIEVSDGIYIGGTATANKLDDYEEGTYNIVFKVGSTQYTATTANFGSNLSNQCKYVKVGAMVTIFIRFQFSSHPSAWTNNSSSLYMDNLPFTPVQGTLSGGCMFNYIEFSSYTGYPSSSNLYRFPDDHGHVNLRQGYTSSLVYFARPAITQGYYSYFSEGSMYAGSFPGPNPANYNYLTGSFTYYTNS
jgi:hypothetical protein